MFTNQSHHPVVAPLPSDNDSCADAGQGSHQPASAPFYNDPAVQDIFVGLSKSFRNIDKLADDLVRLAEHKVIGRVPNFRFVDNEPAEDQPEAKSKVPA